MPYISEATREELKSRLPSKPGELNYQITELIVDYLYANEGLTYQVINDVLGALEGAKAEFYSRVAKPYEKSKRQDNGDVFPRRYTCG